MSANKSKYMVTTQIFIKKDYPEKNILLEETTVFFSRKKDAKRHADMVIPEDDEP